MKQQIHNLTSFFANKKILYAFLFIYFGFMAIPQWFRPFSTQFLIWLLALPVVVLALVWIGIWGLTGIRRAKASQEQPASKYIFFSQIAIAGLLWFAVSFGLANGSHFLYNHQKFNSEIWRNPNSASYVPNDLTPRQRMLDDVIKQETLSAMTLLRIKHKEDKNESA